MSVQYNSVNIICGSIDSSNSKMTSLSREAILYEYKRETLVRF